MPNLSEVWCMRSESSHLAGRQLMRERTGTALAHRMRARRIATQQRILKGDAMEVGYFTMPSHPPECGLKEGNDWDLQTLRWLDELGYQEAWVGEHHTAPWEPNPTPDLLIAQALLQTNPAELANRVA